MQLTAVAGCTLDDDADGRAGRELSGHEGSSVHCFESVRDGCNACGTHIEAR